MRFQNSAFRLEEAEASTDPFGSTDSKIVLRQTIGEQIFQRYDISYIDSLSGQVNGDPITDSQEFSGPLLSVQDSQGNVYVGSQSGDSGKNFIDNNGNTQSSWVVKFLPSGLLDMDWQFVPPTGLAFQMFLRGIYVSPSDRVLISYDDTFATPNLRKYVWVDSNGEIEQAAAFQHVVGLDTRVVFKQDGTDDFYVVGAFDLFGGTSIDSNILRTNLNGGYDDTFVVTSDTGFIFSTTKMSSGKYIVNGSFGQINGVTRNSIARINNDGTLDTSFLSNPNSSVRQVIEQPDERLIIIGDFTQVNFSPRARIARLLSDGSTDFSFTTPTFNGFLNGAALLPNGKILVYGDFTLVSGQSRNGMALLNSDGTLDGSFNLAVSGPFAQVFTSHVSASGEIYLGGRFTSIDGHATNNMAKLLSDGTVDVGFSISSMSAGSFVSCVRELSDNSILFSGDFTQVNGLGASLIAKVDTNGVVDSSFQSEVVGLRVQEFIETSQGDIIAYGLDLIGNGTPSSIFKLSATGEVYSDFQIFTSGSIFNVFEETLTNSLIITSNISLINAVPTSGLVEVSDDLAITNNFPVQFLDSTNFPASRVYPKDVYRYQSNLYLVGNFSRVNSTDDSIIHTTYGVVRLTDSGLIDGTFVSNLRLDSVTYNSKILKVDNTGVYIFTSETPAYNGDDEFDLVTFGYSLVRVAPNGLFDTGFQQSSFAANTGQVSSVTYSPAIGRYIYTKNEPLSNTTFVRALNDLFVDDVIFNNRDLYIVSNSGQTVASYYQLENESILVGSFTYVNSQEAYTTNEIERLIFTPTINGNAKAISEIRIEILNLSFLEPTEEDTYYGTRVVEFFLGGPDNRLCFDTDIQADNFEVLYSQPFTVTDSFLNTAPSAFYVTAYGAQSMILEFRLYICWQNVTEPVCDDITPPTSVVLYQNPDTGNIRLSTSESDKFTVAYILDEGNVVLYRLCDFVEFTVSIDSIVEDYGCLSSPT